jgi:hypothetical protein
MVLLSLFTDFGVYSSWRRQARGGGRGMRAKAAATMGAAAADSDEASAASSGAGTILESEEIQSIVSAMQRKRQGLRDPVNLTINSVANVRARLLVGLAPGQTHYRTGRLSCSDGRDVRG